MHSKIKKKYTLWLNTGKITEFVNNNYVVVEGNYSICCKKNKNWECNSWNK